MLDKNGNRVFVIKGILHKNAGCRCPKYKKKIPIYDTPTRYRRWRTLDAFDQRISLYKAVMYALNNEERLIVYLDDGRIEITSKIIEREMKVIETARKNFLFMNTVRGVQASANIFSVLRRAVMNGLDSEKYMTYLLEKLLLIDTKSEKKIDELMPWLGALP